MSTFENQTPPSEETYAGMKFHHAPSAELRLVIQQTAGRKNEGWLADSSRFCTNFEPNMIGAFLLSNAWREFSKDKEIVSNIFPDLENAILFSLKDVPLDIFNVVSKTLEPLVDSSGANMKADKVVMKQICGAPSGLIVSGPLAGLLVEPRNLKGVNKPDQVERLTVTRLCVEPSGPRSLYQANFPLIDLGKLSPDELHSNEKNIEYVEQLIAFMQKDAHEKMTEKYVALTASLPNYIDQLSAISASLGITFDPKVFNYFLK